MDDPDEKATAGIPDLWITYHGAIQKKLEASKVNIGHDYSPAWGRDYWSGRTLGESGVHVRECEMGTLILGMIDS